MVQTELKDKILPSLKEIQRLMPICGVFLELYKTLSPIGQAVANLGIATSQRDHDKTARALIDASKEHGAKLRQNEEVINKLLTNTPQDLQQVPE